MRKLLITAALAAAFALPAAAADDITMTFDASERERLVRLLDAAVRAGGLQVSGEATYFVTKMRDAMAAADKKDGKPAVPAGPPAAATPEEPKN